MKRNDLRELLVRNSMEILRRDDQNPDVGMGMSIDTAVLMAIDQVLEEAARWERDISIDTPLVTEIRESVRRGRKKW